MKEEHRSYAYALVAVFLWSTVATAFKITLRELSAVELVLFASLVSFVVLGIMLISSGAYRQLVNHIAYQWKRTILLGAINPFIYYLMLFHAYELLPAQEAQAINYTWALMLAYLSVPLLGHHLSRRDILSGLICYMGVLIIATKGNLVGLHFENLFGVTMALLSTFFWALYWIYNIKNSSDIIVVLFSNFAIGILFITVYILLADIPIHLPSRSGAFGAVYIGIFEMGVTFVLWGKALSLSAHTAKIANMIFLSPVLSLFFIHYIAKEQIYNSTVVALGLILFGLFLQQSKHENS